MKKFLAVYQFGDINGGGIGNIDVMMDAVTLENIRTIESNTKVEKNHFWVTVINIIPLDA